MTNKDSKSTNHDDEDFFLKYSGKLIVWAQKNSIGLVVVFGALTLAGAVWAGVSYYQQTVEAKAHNTYFPIEKRFLDLREKRAVAKDKYQTDLLAKKSNSKNEAQKASDYPSGDLSQDYGSNIKELTDFIKSHSETNAAALAGLHLGNLYYEYEMYSDGVNALKMASPSDELIQGMQLMLLGTLKESSGDCTSAIQNWEKLLLIKSVSYLHSEALLKQALCYQNSNKKDLALEVFRRLQTEFADSDAAKKAKGYLRYFETQGS